MAGNGLLPNVPDHTSSHHRLRLRHLSGPTSVQESRAQLAPTAGPEGLGPKWLVDRRAGFVRRHDVGMGLGVAARTAVYGIPSHGLGLPNRPMPELVIFG